MERKYMMHLVADAPNNRSCDDINSHQTTTPVLRALIKIVRLMTRGIGNQRVGPNRMRIVETLTVGPKKQLLLVNCGGEHFLVGTGPESVQTIVRVRPEGEARFSRWIPTENEAQ